MKTRNVVRLLAICLLAGQAVAIGVSKADGRFYPGEPRAAGEVALLVGDLIGTISQCPNFQTLTEAGKPPKALFLGKTMAEVLPGHYTIKIGCLDKGLQPAKGEPIELAIDAQAGHVYYVWVDRKPVEKPVVVADIARDEDYGQIKHGDFVKRCVARYFRGKRHEVKETKLSKDRMGWN